MHLIFFFECENYRIARLCLFRETREFHPLRLEYILYGKPSLFIVVIFFFFRPSIVMSRNRKGFPEKSFVLVTGNSPLYPFIAGNETH